MNRFGFGDTDQQPVFDRLGGKCREIGAVRIQDHTELVGITKVAYAFDPLGFDIDFLKTFVRAGDIINIENDARRIVHGKGGIVGDGSIGQNDDLNPFRLFLEVDHFDAGAFGGRFEDRRVNGFNRRRRCVDRVDGILGIEIIFFDDDITGKRDDNALCGLVDAVGRILGEMDGDFCRMAVGDDL